MGLDYSYALWVPRAQLYEAAAIIAAHEQTVEFSALSWPDWRVRAVAIEWLSGSEDPDRNARAAPCIEAMLDDPRAEVRIAAIDKLGWLDAAREKRQQILLETPSTPDNLGVICAALTSFGESFADFDSLPDETVESNHEVLRRASSLTDFPFKNRIAYILENGF